MNYRIGQKLFRVSADEETGKCEMEICVVRTIRGGNVYAILYLPGITWIKLSKKSGDYGWAKDVGWARHSTPIGTAFRGLFTTKRQAWMDCKKSYQELRNDWGEDSGWLPICDKIIKTATAGVSRESSRKDRA